MSLSGMVEIPHLQAKQVLCCRQATCHSGESRNPGNKILGISGCRIESTYDLLSEKERRIYIATEAESAVFLTNTLPSGKLVLKIDWIEHISHANQLETCMYAGAIKDNNGNITGWREFPSLQEALKKGVFLIKQDARLLNQEVATTAVERTLSGIIQKHALSPSDITWFLPHYSSENTPSAVLHNS